MTRCTARCVPWARGLRVDCAVTHRYAPRRTFLRPLHPLQKFNTSVIPELCNWMANCGFPRNPQLRQTPSCQLYEEWALGNNTAVPSDQRAAVCRLSPPGANCDW